MYIITFNQSILSIIIILSVTFEYTWTELNQMLCDIVTARTLEKVEICI